MFFLASKSLSFVEQPLNLVAMLLLVSVIVWRRRPVMARRAAVAGVLLFFSIGFTAAPRSVLRSLEETHPPTTVPLESLAGAIVLGGAEDAGVKAVERGQVLFNGAGERLTTAIRLLRQYPDYVVVHTGFSGRWDSEGMTESEMARLFFTEQGADVSRVIFENRARDTYENALFTRHLPGVDMSRRWLLVTSALHMPRSMAVFQKLGWHVEPMPVDYRTGRTLKIAEYSIIGGARDWQAAIHELIGFAAYWATGRV
ncbi:MAG TPA: YdcF family protein [Vicinamibacterales bacterium]|nr:YdcF family protein [Vicinamibacterales bacterium]